MRKAYIHIGLEKTGSTYIQEFFEINRGILSKISLYRPSPLKDKNDVVMSLLGIAGIDDNTSIHEIVGLTQNDLEHHNKTLIRALRDSREIGLDAWISSELISSRLLSNVQINQFYKSLLDVYDQVEIIIFVRRQEELILSLYSTALRNGIKKPLVLDQDKLPKRINALQILEAWKNLVGSDKLTVLPYFEDFSDQEIISLLLNHLKKIDFVSEFHFPKTRPNKSLSYIGQEIMRRILEEYGKLDKNLRRKVEKMIEIETQNDSKFRPTQFTIEAARADYSQVNIDLSKFMQVNYRDRFLNSKSSTDYLDIELDELKVAETIDLIKSTHFR